MAAQIVPSEYNFKAVDMSDSDTLSLIRHAEESAAADSKLTIRQALKKYKKVWRNYMNTALKGTDVVFRLSSGL